MKTWRRPRAASAIEWVMGWRCTRSKPGAKAAAMKTPPHTGSAPPLWSTETGYVRMMIRDLVTEVRLGLHPWERHPEKPQRIVVNIDMYAAPAAGRARGKERAVVDYDPIREALRKWPGRRHTVYIETLVDEL